VIRRNKTVKRLLEAARRGYRVDGQGNVTGPYGPVQGGTSSRNGTLYRHFSIRFEGETGKVFVHQLQAYQKYGFEALFVGAQALHRNNQSSDNSNSNIFTGTAKDNWMDRPPAVRQAIAQTAADAKKRWSDDDVRRLRFARSNGKTVTELAREENVYKGQMSAMLNSKTYRSVK
jgi:hypothetical protein